MQINNIISIESLILCKLNKQRIGELDVSYVTSNESYIDETPKIVLKVYKYTFSQIEKRKEINLLYDEIKPKRYLLLNEKDYYIIEDVKELRTTGVKEIVAYSGEKILERRQINIENIGIQILDDDIENDVYSLNTLLSEIGWKLGEVDNAIRYSDIENKIPKLRWQESIDDNWLNFMKTTIANQFNCLPTFNASNRTVDLHDIDLLGEEIKICLSKDNYIKSRTKENNSEELITLLKLKGSEELDIAKHIIGGYDFITNFSYFIETKEMSSELIHALAKYEEMIEIRHPQWIALANEKVNKESELNIKRNQWTISISTIDCYKRMIDNYVLLEDTINENETKVVLAKEIDNELILRLQIEDLLKEIDMLQESIDNVNLLCKYETCTDEKGELVFSSETLNELQEFIFMDIYSDDSFVNADDMIKKGEAILEEKSKPTLEVEIDSINFMSRIVDNDFRLKWNGDLSFGDIVILIDEHTEEEEYYYFLGYDMNYENNSLSLRISNKKTLRENTKTINNWLKEIKKTKLLLMDNKYLFNKIKENRLNIDKGDVR